MENLTANEFIKLIMAYSTTGEKYLFPYQGKNTEYSVITFPADYVGVFDMIFANYPELIQLMPYLCYEKDEEIWFDYNAFKKSLNAFATTNDICFIYNPKEETIEFNFETSKIKGIKASYNKRILKQAKLLAEIIFSVHEYIKSEREMHPTLHFEQELYLN